MLDFYCERIEPGLISEPFNLLTNIAFFISSWAIWRLGKSSSALDIETYTLSLIVAAIGVGSALFHSFASFWAWLLDVFPILLFQITFIWLYLRRLAHVRKINVAILLLVFLTLIFSLWVFGEGLNGSLPYFPAAFSLIILGAYHYKNCTFNKMAILNAGILFIGAIIFRSIDVGICSSIEIGTHFIWHLLNALAIYICVRAYLLNRSN